MNGPAYSYLTEKGVCALDRLVQAKSDYFSELVLWFNPYKHCVLFMGRIWGYAAGFSSKNQIKRITPGVPLNESGLIQMIGMGKSIRHKWGSLPEPKTPGKLVLFLFGVR